MVVTAIGSLLLLRPINADPAVAWLERATRSSSTPIAWGRGFLRLARDAPRDSEPRVLRTARRSPGVSGVLECGSATGRAPAATTSRRFYRPVAEGSAIVEMAWDEPRRRSRPPTKPTTCRDSPAVARLAQEHTNARPHPCVVMP